MKDLRKCKLASNLCLSEIKELGLRLKNWNKKHDLGESKHHHCVIGETLLLFSTLSFHFINGKNSYLSVKIKISDVAEIGK